MDRQQRKNEARRVIPKRLNICVADVGAVAVTRCSVLGNNPGALAVCYERYQIGKRNGWSFIFENGLHDGFAPKDLIALEPVGWCYMLSNYKVENVMELRENFEQGVFDPVFKYHGLWTRD